MSTATITVTARGLPYKKLQFENTPIIINESSVPYPYSLNASKKLQFENTPLITNQSSAPWTIPNTLNFLGSKYTLDSTNKASGTIVGLTLGGLYGQYFNGHWRGTISTGNIGTLPLSNATLFTSIAYGSRADYYGFIAIGYFVPPTTGTYNFWTSSNDGSGVWIGDIARASSGRNTSNAVVNNGMGVAQSDTKRGGSINLTAGQVYPIRIVHEEDAGGDNLTFSWSGPGINETTNLTQYFYYYQTGVNFSNTGPVVGFNEINRDNITYNDNPAAQALYYKDVFNIRSTGNKDTTNPAASTRYYKDVFSIRSSLSQISSFTPIESTNRTIYINSGVVPYDIQALRVRDSTVTAVEFRVSRIIDSAVVIGVGSVAVSGADKQIWY